MAWLRIESSVSRNRKFVKAGPGPAWLWICGLAYCQEGLTDGFIPFEAIGFLGVKHAHRLAVHLVSAGLWHREEDGWRVHDYLAHNRSALDVEGIRAARAAGGQHGGRPRKNLHDNLPHHVKVSTEKPSEKPQGLTLENPSTSTSTATALKTESPEPSNGSGPPVCASPTVLEFPVVGADGPTWGLTEAQLADWGGLFPTLDVEQNARNALAWVRATPGRRKTARGMPKFLVGWFTRCVDRG